MRAHRKVTVLIVSLTFFALSSSSHTGWLSKRSSLDLRIGIWNGFRAGNKYSPSGVSSAAQSSGFIGGLSFSHWWAEDLSFVASIGMLNAEASSSVTPGAFVQRASTVVPLLLGVQYYVPSSTLDSDLRPYITASVGPAMGFEARNDLLGQVARKESAIDLHVGAGVDFRLSNLFKAGVGAGYHLMSDFSEPVGARKNYSGPSFHFSIGILFGSVPE